MILRLADKGDKHLTSGESATYTLRAYGAAGGGPVHLSGSSIELCTSQNASLRNPAIRGALPGNSSCSPQQIALSRVPFLKFLKAPHERLERAWYPAMHPRSFHLRRRQPAATRHAAYGPREEGATYLPWLSPRLVLAAHDISEGALYPRGTCTGRPRSILSGRRPAIPQGGCRECPRDAGRSGWRSLA
jgi:hypothetical protein